jgi:hypothetical protein
MATPEGVKRQLRQEAGFGCCSCGYPFIEYHHIVAFADEAHFRPEDMMVLCSRCHDLCTAGAIPEMEQRAIKARPKNIVDNLLKGPLYVTSPHLRVELAGAVVTNTPRLLELGGIEVLGARRSDDGRVLISATIQDSEGQPVAALVENEWILSPTDVWDFEVRPLVATIRSASARISFAVDCRKNRVRLQGEWHFRGMPIRFSPTEAQVGTNIVRGGSVTNCGGFISIG